MTSNYNVILLPIEVDGKHKVGDTFKASETSNWRIQKFDGLKIQRIDYCWGVRLHFDWNEWENNIAKTKKLCSNKK